MNHREAWAEERKAPQRTATSAPDRSPAATTTQDDEDILVVASKVKGYIKDTSGMNTSAGVFPVLSAHVRAHADRAIAAARQAHRQTVLDRDIPSPTATRSPGTFVRRRRTESND